MIRIVALALILLLSHSFSTSAQFTKISNSPVSEDGQESMGVAWVDYDNDGDDDLSVTVSYLYQGLVSYDLLYTNNGDGSFTKITTGPLVEEQGTGRNSTWADFNNDGLVDVFVTNQLETSLFKNDGGGVFTKVSDIPTTGFSTVSDHAGAAWGDYNGDGYVDLFLASYKIADDARNVLYVNNKDGSFTQFPEGVISPAQHGSDPSWIDYDNNGTLDLLALNYCEENFLYANQGDGTFSNITNNALVLSNCSVGASWADYDNDGDFDVFIQNNVNQQSQLFENNGEGSFTEKGSVAAAHTSSSAAWADFDNDGFIDLVTVGSYPERRTYLYRNNGDKAFTDVSEEQQITNTAYSWGVAWSDYDKDGFPDLFIANAELGAPYPTDDVLYRNKPNSNGWINVKLRGTHVNRSAIGAIVRIGAGGKRQTRTVQSKTGNNSQNSLNVHFGIGSSSKIDTLQVEWPGKGFQEVLNVDKNQFMELVEPDFSESPVNLTATSTITGKAELNWNDNSLNETGFRIERSIGDKMHFKPLLTVSQNTTSFLDEGVRHGNTYFYRVASTTQEGFSVYLNIAEVSVITGIYDHEYITSVYPNPADDFLEISTELSGNKAFKIFNTAGQTVYSGALTSTKERISIKHLSEGIYILTLDNKRFKIMKR